LPKANQQGALPHVAKIGAVLAVAFEEHAVARKGVDTGIERGQRTQRAIDEGAVMDHAVRVAIGLSLERRSGYLLMPRTQLGNAALV
jgi:hypothetical protein